MPIKIKVVGIGGSGSNAVSRMMTSKVGGVELIAANTDIQDLKKTRAHKKIRIGKNLTRGLGTGMNPEVGRKAAEEQREEIKEALEGADIIFITCGEGGGTGSGAAPVVAEIARNTGALTVAIVTRPFSFEGSCRMKIARQGIENLRSKVDTLLIVSNDKILSLAEQNTTLLSAFWACDEVLRQAVTGITDLILLPGLINLDFSNIKSVLKDSGVAFLGIGSARGEKRADEATKLAVNSPLLDASIKGAKKVLFNLSGGEDLKLTEVDAVAKIITASANPEARTVFGVVKDRKLPKGEIKIMIIATGFENLE